MFGVAITTSSIAVASRCPGPAPKWARSRPRTSPIPGWGAGLDLLESGLSATEAMNRLMASAPEPHYRQVTMIDAHGHVAAWSGSKTLGMHGASRRMTAWPPAICCKTRRTQGHDGRLRAGAGSAIRRSPAGRARGRHRRRGEMGRSTRRACWWFMSRTGRWSISAHRLGRGESDPAPEAALGGLPAADERLCGGRSTRPARRPMACRAIPSRRSEQFLRHDLRDGQA